MPRPDASAKLAATAPKGGNRGTIAIVVALFAVVAVATAIFLGARGSGSNATGAQSIPKGAAALGEPMVVNPSAPANVPTLVIYEDPQCPACAQLDALYGPTIAELAKTNAAKVVVHTMTFLDTNLKTDHSRRAAQAAYCAADQGRFLEYMTEIYAGQPAREGDGWTDVQLEAFAIKAKVADLPTWQSCVKAKTYAAHADAVAENSLKSGVNGTPTVKINGTVLKLTGNPAELTAAVKAATK